MIGITDIWTYLLRAAPPLFLVLKYAGAAYLGYVGIRMLAGALRTWRQPVQAPTREPVVLVEQPIEDPFRRAFMISLLTSSTRLKDSVGKVANRVA